MTAIGSAATLGARADELEPALIDALGQTEAAVEAMRNGDPEPFIACWADSANATLFGAWGPIEHGSALIDTFRWVGSRYAGDRSPSKPKFRTSSSPQAATSPTPSDLKAARYASIEDASKT